jgi:hypothetical protein
MITLVTDSPAISYLEGFHFGGTLTRSDHGGMFYIVGVMISTIKDPFLVVASSKNVVFGVKIMVHVSSRDHVCD